MNSWIDQEADEHKKQMEAKGLVAYDVNPEYEARLIGSEVKRQAASLHESEQTEKTLHHLAGRVEELRARLERVLVPAGGTGNSASGSSGPAEPISPLTSRLRNFRHLAQSSRDIVEDIPNRLDV